MPVIKSAIKKLRKDRLREARNDEFRKTLDNAIREASKLKSQDKIIAAIALVDKAAKKNVFHKNKAARLKSRLAKLASTKSIARQTTKLSLKTKKTSKKPSTTTLQAG